MLSSLADVVEDLQVPLHGEGATNGCVNDILEQVAARTRLLVDALADADLDAPSLLPGWSRLTVACHLRYGAEAMLRMTEDTTAGRLTAYYPSGRVTQRPGTLVPRGTEDAVASLRETSTALDDAWASVSDWRLLVTEPEDNVDLGPYPLQHMPLFRLTEVEVHGTDLDVGLPPWSDVLIELGLPMRLERLTRRTPLAPGAWIVGGVRVGDDSEPEVVDATPRDLFALTLGRIHLSESFSRAYPGP